MHSTEVEVPQNITFLAAIWIRSAAQR